MKQMDHTTKKMIPDMNVVDDEAIEIETEKEIESTDDTVMIDTTSQKTMIEIMQEMKEVSFVSN